MQNFKPSSISFPCPVLMIGTFDEFKKPNLMNAAWGGIYDTNMFYLCLDKSHKTSKNLLKNGELTISFATLDTVKFADYAGMKSSNKENKLDSIDVKYHESACINAPIFDIFPISLECKVNNIKDENNTLYVVLDIINVSVREDAIKNNKIDTSNINFVCFDPALNKYRVIGNSILDAFTQKEYKNE